MSGVTIQGLPAPRPRITSEVLDNAVSATVVVNSHHDTDRMTIACVHA